MSRESISSVSGTRGRVGHSGGSDPIRPINRSWEFHNTDLSTHVDAAYQALAIDEKRRPFKPTVWTVQNDAPAKQRVEQVWFPGVHCDVGGGNPDHGLSDIALLWMVDRAIRSGLSFREGSFVHEPDPPAAPDGGATSHEEPEDEMRRRCTRVMPDPFAEIKDSRRWFYRLIPALNRQPDFSDTSGQSLSRTALQRRLKDSRYGPVNFVDHFDDDEIRRSGPGLT